MKKRDLIRHLKQHNCELLREGSRHSWWWNPNANLRSSIPRHREISDIFGDHPKVACADITGLHHWVWVDKGTTKFRKDENTKKSVTSDK